MTDRVILKQRDRRVETRCCTEIKTSKGDWVAYALWKTVRETSISVDECRRNHERMVINEPDQTLRFVVQDVEIDSVTTITVED